MAQVILGLARAVAGAAIHEPAFRLVEAMIRTANLDARRTAGLNG